MNYKAAQNQRVLAITINMHGVGFAVLDGALKLIDWGINKARASASSAVLNRIGELVERYAPDVVVLEDLELSPFRHSERILALNASLRKLTERAGIRVRRLSLGAVKRQIVGDEQGTKHEVAQKLASRFPDEIDHLLPPKRVAWKPEHYRMGIFDAIALAVAALSGGQHISPDVCVSAKHLPE